MEPSSFWQDRRVIVTGGAGFLGSFIVEKLKQRGAAEVIVPRIEEYDLVNLEGRSMAGQAIPSYAPLQSAQYFQKLECFCFEQQTLAAGETRKFPVVFFIDPDLPRDVTQITLSYTFFEIPGAVKAVPAAAAAGGGDGRS